MDNTLERNVLVGQVVGLVENSGLEVNLLEDRLVDPVQEKDFQKEPSNAIGLDTELIVTTGRAKNIKELVNRSKEKCAEPKRSWAKNSNISESERRKRDSALKRRKWNKLHLDESELSGKSLSDSNISNRVSKLVKEAKHVLKVGKKIGFNIVGEEKDIINDIVELELKEAKEN
ncbi:hypothetical protein V6N13_069471 [Hibiscus sabdariffa]